MARSWNLKPRMGGVIILAQVRSGDRERGQDQSSGENAHPGDRRSVPRVERMKTHDKCLLMLKNWGKAWR